jgi:NAD(P)H-hydrate epimerase
MAGLAALRAGAGLVTVACADSNLTAVAPELMTAALPDLRSIGALAEKKDVIAIGPGLGADPALAALARSLFADSDKPLVVDADGLNALVGHISGLPGAGKLRVLTPHPGEMARLIGRRVTDRVGEARSMATERQVVLVLKGERTLIAFPDGRVWINPTGTPAMGTGGTGDILTGMVAGFLGQFPTQPEQAILAAVYLHGHAGELGAATRGEKSLIATDLLDFLPAAIQACANLSDQI